MRYGDPFALSSCAITPPLLELTVAALAEAAGRARDPLALPEMIEDVLDQGGALPAAARA